MGGGGGGPDTREERRPARGPRKNLSAAFADVAPPGMHLANPDDDAPVKYDPAFDVFRPEGLAAVDDAPAKIK